MEPFITPATQSTNFQTSNKFDARQEISYISALAFEKYEKLQFVDKTDGKVHYELDFITVDTCQENPLDEPVYSAWNKDGTRFFFLGYVDPIHDLHNYKERWKRWGLLFVLLDVEHKTILKTYKPDIKNPRWSNDGSEVLFDNQPTEIPNLDDFIQEKTQDYISGLNSTFQKAFNGEAVNEVEYDEDLVPLEFMAGRSILTEQLSPDKAFCVRFYRLFTPENEPLQMTFTVFQYYKDRWHPIYDLPNSYYCVNGIDHFEWHPNSHTISYSVNHFEQVFFFDFFYHKVVQYNVPQDFTECEWNGTVGKCLAFKTPRGIDNVFLSFPEATSTIYKQWKDGKTIMLSRMARNGDSEPYLYKVAFVSVIDSLKFAVCPAYFVQGEESIRISESGWTSFQAFDADRTKQFLVYCDLSTLGKDEEFKVASWELPLVPERFDWDENKEKPEESRWQPIVHGHPVLRHRLLDSTNVINLPLMSSPGLHQ